MPWTIKKEDIPFISVGAKMLSCGGGGDPKTVECLLLSVMGEDDEITVKMVNELSTDWVVPIGIAGSPILFSEDLPSGQEGIQVISTYEQISGKKVRAVISFEMGGMNALVPLLIALQMKLPVIDGDGMGRAFPELSMTTFDLNNIPLFPLVAQSGNASTSVSENGDPNEAIEKMKELSLQHSGYVFLSCFGTHGDVMQSAVVAGTLKLALKLGQAVLTSPYTEKLKNIQHTFINSVYGKSKIVTLGYVSYIERWFDHGRLVGKCHISGIYNHEGKKVEISFKNEFLSIVCQGEFICTTPDLILLMDHYSFMPKFASELQEGDVVHVLAIPAPSILRTKDMLERVGPRKFNIATNYQSIQSLEGEREYETGY